MTRTLDNPPILLYDGGMSVTHTQIMDAVAAIPDWFYEGANNEEILGFVADFADCDKWEIARDPFRAFALETVVVARRRA